MYYSEKHGGELKLKGFLNEINVTSQDHWNISREGHIQNIFGEGRTMKWIKIWMLKTQCCLLKTPYYNIIIVILLCGSFRDHICSVLSGQWLLEINAI